MQNLNFRVFYCTILHNIVPPNKITAGVFSESYVITDTEPEGYSPTQYLPVITLIRF